MRNNTGALNSKIVYTCLIVLSFLLLALKQKTNPQYIHSEQDYRVHMQNHIQNVYLLGMAFYNQHRNTLFKDVPEDLLKEKLLMHDREKEAYMSELASFSGQNKENNPQLQELISQVNSLGKSYEIAFYKKHGLVDQRGTYSHIAILINFIEKIADTTEREGNPVTPDEMGVEKSRKASEYFNNPFEKMMVENFSKNYAKIAIPNPLIYTTNLNLLSPQCSVLFN